MTSLISGKYRESLERAIKVNVPETMAWLEGVCEQAITSPLQCGVRVDESIGGGVRDIYLDKNVPYGTIEFYKAARPPEG